MDRFEVGSLITLFLAYVIIILLIVFYEVTKCKRSEMKAFKYKRQFYILAITLIAILFVYFLHIALYYCPKQNNVNQKEGKEGNQTGTSNPI